MSLQRVNDQVLRVASRDKKLISSLFLKKSYERGDPFFYLLYYFLDNTRVAYSDSTMILATDGSRILVGKNYPLAKSVYGDKILPFLWGHEILHIIHLHIDRMRFVEDKKLYNIVADLYINEELSRRIGRIPDSFVTLSSALSFIERHLGRSLSTRDRELLGELLEGVVSGVVSVDRAYRVIKSMKSVSIELKRMFTDSSFFGRDLPSEREDFNSSKDTLTEYKRLVNNSRNVLSEVRKVVSTFETINKVLKKTTGGHDEGSVFTLGEYGEIKLLSTDLEKILQDIVGGKVKDIDISYSDINEYGYWLPRDIEIRHPRITVLLDVSSSVSKKGVILFLSILRNLVRRYNLEGDLVTFSNGVRERMKITSRVDRLSIMGTTKWDETISEVFTRETKENTPLIIVLSDFYIEIDRGALEAIKSYKSRGGKIACVTTDKTGSFCDVVVKIPTALTRDSTELV